MAKGNAFLGTLSRKLGDVVFYRANGVQQARTRVTPKNPQTEAQNIQRMVFASLTSSASALREIVDHSFKGVEQGQRSINHFVSINTPIARALTDANSMSPNGFLIKGVKGIALLPMQVSNGSLPPLVLDTPILSYLGENRLRLLCGEIGTAFNNITTPQAYETALNIMGLSSGEQLTMVSIVTACNPDGEPTPLAVWRDATNYSTWALYGRIVFKKAEDIVIPDGGLNLVVNNQFNPAVIDFDRSADWVNKVSVHTATSYVEFRMVTGGETTIGLGGTLIRSRLTSAKTGVWDFSPASLFFGGELVDYSQNANASVVAPSYGAAAAEATSPMYLEQANNSNAIGSDAGFKPLPQVVRIVGLSEEGLTINQNRIIVSGASVGLEMQAAIQFEFADHSLPISVRNIGSSGDAYSGLSARWDGANVLLSWTSISVSGGSLTSQLLLQLGDKLSYEFVIEQGD